MLVWLHSLLSTLYSHSQPECVICLYNFQATYVLLMLGWIFVPVYITAGVSRVIYRVTYFKLMNKLGYI